MRLGGPLAMGIGLSRASGVGAKGFLQRERRLLARAGSHPSRRRSPLSLMSFVKHCGHG
jgi:hypothetical protein